VAAGWLRNGEPDFVVRGELRELLLEIKGGRVPLVEVLEAAERMVPALECARDQSPLPDRPDYRRADELVRRIGEELARRFVEKTPGPLGRDAPAPPRMENSP
jgi:hypothetical protein